MPYYFDDIGNRVEIVTTPASGSGSYDSDLSTLESQISLLDSSADSLYNTINSYYSTMGSVNNAPYLLGELSIYGVDTSITSEQFEGNPNKTFTIRSFYGRLWSDRTLEWAFVIQNTTDDFDSGVCLFKIPRSSTSTVNIEFETCPMTACGSGSSAGGLRGTTNLTQITFRVFTGGQNVPYDRFRIQNDFSQGWGVFLIRGVLTSSSYNSLVGYV